MPNEPKAEDETRRPNLCGAKNANLIAYEEPREGNPFETTVFAFDTGEASCERLAGHRGKHGFIHRGGYVAFSETEAQEAHSYTEES